MTSTDYIETNAYTKLIATIGPACRKPDILLEMIQQGVDVFRLNMAHGSRSEHEGNLAQIREAAEKAGRPVGILADLGGPKIRLGKLHTDPTICHHGDHFEFVRGEEATAANQLVATYDRLLDELSEGDPVMLADGTVSLRVVEKTADAVRCEVEEGGEIRSRQGINLPGVTLSVPSITEDDRKHAAWAADNGIDFVGLSFVRGTDELHELRDILQSHESNALVIAKIEKKEALDRLDEIVEVADGVMVARGDLGVEIDVAEIAIAQKRIIETCRQIGRPVIVATQMLDSMQHSRRPTRAEVTDVANAIIDGADACMLSGETAIGDYPREAVTMMNRIMLATEREAGERDRAHERREPISAVLPITSAVVSGATRIAEQLSAGLVVVATRSGATALARSKRRAYTPTVGVSSSETTLRKMCLYWGIIPLAGAPVDEPPRLRRFINDWGLSNDVLEIGDSVVSISGTGIVDRAHNSVVVHEVEEA